MPKQVDLGSDEEFKQNYIKLRSASKMAELYGVCENTIKRHVKRIGFDLNQLNLGRVRDLTNQKFGKLTAIKVIGKDSIDNNVWLCRCECGNETKVSTRNLTSGNTKSCGKCKRIYIKTPNGPYYIPNRNDLTGKRFGKLTALYPTEERTRWQSVIWMCKCDCGNYYKVSSQHLTSGNTKSCGCMASSNECNIAKMFQQNGINYEAQYTFDDLRGIGGGLLKFDFAVLHNDGSLSHLIEYNGKQHYFPSVQFGG